MESSIIGKIVLEALILTSAVVLSLTGYTFWASKRGQDFSFLGPILFASLNVLILTGFLQVGLLVPNSFSVSIYEVLFEFRESNNLILILKSLNSFYMSYLYVNSDFPHNLICSCSSLLDLQSMLFTVQ